MAEKPPGVPAAGSSPAHGSRPTGLARGNRPTANAPKAFLQGRGGRVRAAPSPDEPERILEEFLGHSSGEDEDDPRDEDEANDATGTAYAEIKTLTKAFNTKIDKLKSRVADVAAGFAEAGVNVRAQALLFSEEARRGYTEQPEHVFLAYGKNNNAWGFWIETHEGEPDDGNVSNVVPLDGTSREIRILAAKKMPEIYSQILTQLRSGLRDVDEAMEAVESVAGDLPASHPKAVKPEPPRRPPPADISEFLDHTGGAEESTGDDDIPF
jgi:hypothetical protein